MKLALVAAGLVILGVMKRDVFRKPDTDKSPLPGRIKILAGASLVCWFATIASGRLLAYTYSQLLLSL